MSSSSSLTTACFQSSFPCWPPLTASWRLPTRKRERLATSSLIPSHFTVNCGVVPDPGSLRRTRQSHHHIKHSLFLRMQKGEPPTASSSSDDELSNNYENDDEEFFKSRLAQLEALEEMFEEFEVYDDLHDDDDDLEYDDDILWDEESLTELLGTIVNETEDEMMLQQEQQTSDRRRYNSPDETAQKQQNAAAGLERALLQGVVPVSAGVGSDSLPGDFGFDPLHLATKDYFRATQSFLLTYLVPGGKRDQELNSVRSAAKDTSSSQPRARALILRDYREAEIRHGRLAMLAAVVWPLQELLDRFILDPDQFGPLLYGPVTLPYFPLLMTLIMLLLGYLDIYSQAVKERDSIGEAFLPGDCFWDPLRMLEGAPDRMKRNMQERELFNGRVAMLAVAAYIWEEGYSHVALVNIPANELLFEPIFQIPFVQNWLDDQFVVTTTPDLYESYFSAPNNGD